MINDIIVGVVTTVTLSLLTLLARSAIKQGKQIKLLMIGMQQNLRHDLMHMYHKCMRWGCISDDDAELFEAMYNAYHSLGHNGVMTSRYEEIMELRKVPYYGYLENEKEEVRQAKANLQ